MEPRTVHLFVFDGLADWEAGHAVAGINTEAFQLRPGAHRVRTVGLDPQPVTTRGGLRVLPDTTLDALDPASSAMLILPGGDAWDQGGNNEATQKARSFLAAGVPVAAICGATAGLARAGMLDDKRHTSNAREYLQATGYAGAALYSDEPAVTDGDLITASGIAPVDFAYHVFSRLGLYRAEVLDAWRGLFKSGDPAYYAALLKATQG